MRIKLKSKEAIIVTFIITIIDNNTLLCQVVHTHEHVFSYKFHLNIIIIIKISQNIIYTIIHFLETNSAIILL